MSWTARAVRQVAWIALFVLGTGMVTGAAANPDKIAYGKHLSQECTTCHRTDGRGTNIPPIFGLEANYFISTMKFYKTGARDNPVMNSVAQALGDEQLEALAAYFATLKPPAKSTPAKKK